jgi:hypothetical protein
MNMRILIKPLALLALGFVLLSFNGCKKDPSLFEVNSLDVLPPNAGKTKLKTNEQYVAILYANLFQTALSANQIFRISECIQSIGDKEIAREVIISNFMNKPGVIMPTEAEMRGNLDIFITETYVRFLVRNPTEAEKVWFTNFIEGDPNVNPELVYFSFALCNEYMYY